MNEMRKQCLEWAITIGATDPIATAQKFLAFLEEREAEDAEPAGERNQHPAMAVIERVGAVHGVAAGEICGKRRYGSLVRIREEAISAVHSEFPELSMSDIGRLFKKDHTSILASLRRTGDWTRGAFSSNGPRLVNAA